MEHHVRLLGHDSLAVPVVSPTATAGATADGSNRTNTAHSWGMDSMEVYITIRVGGTCMLLLLFACLAMLSARQAATIRDAAAVQAQQRQRLARLEAAAKREAERLALATCGVVAYEVVFEDGGGGGPGDGPDGSTSSNKKGARKYAVIHSLARARHVLLTAALVDLYAREEEREKREREEAAAAAAGYPSSTGSTAVNVLSTARQGQAQRSGSTAPAPTTAPAAANSAQPAPVPIPVPAAGAAGASQESPLAAARAKLQREPAPPLLKLLVLSDRGPCTVCAEDAAADVVALGACPHTICGACAARVAACPFCRKPIVSACPGQASNAAADATGATVATGMHADAKATEEGQQQHKDGDHGQEARGRIGSSGSTGSSTADTSQHGPACEGVVASGSGDGLPVVPVPPVGVGLPVPVVVAVDAPSQLGPQVSVDMPGPALPAAQLRALG